MSNMVKKNIRSIVVGVLLFSVILGGCHSVREKNIMEELYQEAYVKDNIKEFVKVKELETITDDDIAEGYDYFGGVSIPYKQQYIKDDFKIKLFFPTDKEEVHVRGVVRLSDTTNLIIYMKYSHENQAITFDPVAISDWPTDAEIGNHYYDSESIYQYLDQYGISKQDIREFQDYILYDVVLQTWVKRNGENYNLSKDDYKNLKIIDNTFLFSE